MNDKSTTDFGYEQVRTEEKAGRVADVFHSVADKYDLMNDVMSFGIHRLWKRFTIEMCGLRAGHIVLDLAGGTGDLAIKQARRVGDSGHVILADINASMLREGRDRVLDKGLVKRVSSAQCNAEILPFADNSFDCITIAFGLRNVTDKVKALKSMQRVLRPGGRMIALQPNIKYAPGAYWDFYDHHIPLSHLSCAEAFRLALMRLRAIAFAT